MTWLLWAPLFGASISATLLAVSWYLAWSLYMKTPRPLTIVGGLSTLVLIICLGLAALGFLWGVRP